MAENEEVAVINHRCSKLGEWLRMSRSLHKQKQEDALKASMPKERRKILESKKKLCFMRKIIQDEQYDDKDLAVNLEKGFPTCRGSSPLSRVAGVALVGYHFHE